jgi:hypothetical protein
MATNNNQGMAMELTETCVLCGKADLAQRFGVWFVHDDRRPVHLECWLVAYDIGRDSSRRSA